MLGSVTSPVAAAACWLPEDQIPKLADTGLENHAESAHVVGISEHWSARLAPTRPV